MIVSFVLVLNRVEPARLVLCVFLQRLSEFVGGELDAPAREHALKRTLDFGLKAYSGASRSSLANERGNDRPELAHAQAEGRTAVHVPDVERGARVDHLRIRECPTGRADAGAAIAPFLGVEAARVVELPRWVCLPRGARCGADQRGYGELGVGELGDRLHSSP